LSLSGVVKHALAPLADEDLSGLELGYLQAEAWLSAIGLARCPAGDLGVIADASCSGQRIPYRALEMIKIRLLAMGERRRVLDRSGVPP
jgi:hypothetical protein